MADERIQRRLAAILAADVVGYSRQMGADEPGTLAALKDHRARLIDPTIAEYRGRTVKLMGDGALVEFASVVDAVECAATIQRAMSERNAGTPEGRQIAFRIGINLGDIIIDGDDIYGDGVNVAARLEALAEPGGICVSGAVYDQVRDRVADAFDDMGAQEVKNIEREVRVWRWQGDTPPPTVLSPTDAVPSLPDAPSIAVLPFHNMSGDPEQEYFADGLAEDIITTLSKVPNLFVIARNSSFAYKGTSPDVRTVAAELGVKLVLEGSVRRGGDRLRITAQLIDAETGHHVWADRYDRVIDDLFEIQDEITKEIVTASRIELTDGEIARIWSEGTRDIIAWGYVVEASELFSRWGAADNRRTRELARKAADLDPDYATAWALLAATYWYETRIALDQNADELIGEASKYVERALAIDPANPYALGVNALSKPAQGVPAQGVEICARGIALNPGSADMRAYRAFCLLGDGQAEAAIAEVEIAVRHNPHPPVWYHAVLARARDAAGDAAGALEVVSAVLAREGDNFPALLHGASLYARSGRDEDARRVARDVLRVVPDFRIALIAKWLMMRDSAFVDAFADGLRMSGLPE